MEVFLLNFVLNWKLTHHTPFDYIQTLACEISKNNNEFKNNINNITKKAAQITELLLICNFGTYNIAHVILYNCSTFSIALASLRGAIQILKRQSLLCCVDKFVNRKNKVKYPKRIGRS